MLVIVMPLRSVESFLGRSQLSSGTFQSPSEASRYLKNHLDLMASESSSMSGILRPPARVGLVAWSCAIHLRPLKSPRCGSGSCRDGTSVGDGVERNLGSRSHTKRFIRL